MLSTICIEKVYMTYRLYSVTPTIKLLTIRQYLYTCNWERKDWEQGIDPKRHAQQLKKRLMILKISSMTAQEWLSSLQEWVVEQVQVQHQ